MLNGHDVTLLNFALSRFSLDADFVVALDGFLLPELVNLTKPAVDDSFCLHVA